MWNKCFEISTKINTTIGAVHNKWRKVKWWIAMQKHRPRYVFWMVYLIYYLCIIMREGNRIVFLQFSILIPNVTLPTFWHRFNLHGRLNRFVRKFLKSDPVRACLPSTTFSRSVLVKTACWCHIMYILSIFSYEKILFERRHGKYSKHWLMLVDLWINV